MVARALVAVRRVSPVVPLGIGVGRGRDVLRQREHLRRQQETLHVHVDARRGLEVLGALEGVDGLRRLARIDEMPARLGPVAAHDGDTAEIVGALCGVGHRRIRLDAAIRMPRLQVALPCRLVVARQLVELGGADEILRGLEQLARLPGVPAAGQDLRSAPYEFLAGLATGDQAHGVDLLDQLLDLVGHVRARIAAERVLRALQRLVDTRRLGVVLPLLVEIGSLDEAVRLLGMRAGSAVVVGGALTHSLVGRRDRGHLVVLLGLVEVDGPFRFAGPQHALRAARQLRRLLIALARLDPHLQRLEGFGRADEVAFPFELACRADELPGEIARFVVDRRTARGPVADRNEGVGDGIVEVHQQHPGNQPGDDVDRNGECPDEFANLRVDHVAHGVHEKITCARGRKPEQQIEELTWETLHRGRSYPCLDSRHHRAE